MQIKFGTVTTEPITLSEAKIYCKANDYNDEDTLITLLIKGVREKIEMFTGLAITAKTIEYFDDEIADEIKLPYPAHDSITEVKINGVVSTAYQKTGLNQFIIYPDSTYVTNAADSGIYIKYETSGICPEDIKLEMLKIIDEKLRNRGNTFEGSIVELKENAYSNLAQYCLQ